MKTVGEILKQARTDQGISLATVAGQTKIQLKYIRALEENNFDKLPPAAFVKGFVRSYARVVSKDPEGLLAIFRRDYDQNERGEIVPRGLAAGVTSSKSTKRQGSGMSFFPASLPTSRARKRS